SFARARLHLNKEIKIMRYALSAFSIFFLSACGGGDPGGYGASGTELTIYLPTLPSCWSEPPPGTFSSTVTSDAYNQLASATRQMAEFQLSFDLQEAQLVANPLIEAPRATSWHFEHDNGTHVDGTMIAHGEDWAEVRMVAVFTTPWDGEKK